jgi:hypothetical protein
VEALLEELAVRPERVFDRNDGEDTPLTFACWRENWDVVEVLVRNGSDVNAQDAVSSGSCWVFDSSLIYRMLVRLDCFNACQWSWTGRYSCSAD